jgi:hypothetical protein
MSEDFAGFSREDLEEVSSMSCNMIVVMSNIIVVMSWSVEAFLYTLYLII